MSGCASGKRGGGWPRIARASAPGRPGPGFRQGDCPVAGASDPVQSSSCVAPGPCAGGRAGLILSLTFLPKAADGPKSPAPGPLRAAIRVEPTLLMVDRNLLREFDISDEELTAIVATEDGGDDMDRF